MTAEEMQKLKDWIDSLEGEAREGAIAAVARILSGRDRTKPEGPLPPPPEELPVDPDLDDPEDDPSDDEPEDDIDIDDPENLLKPKDKSEEDEGDSKDSKDSKDKPEGKGDEDEVDDEDERYKDSDVMKDLEKEEAREHERFKRKVEAARMKKQLEKARELAEEDPSKCDTKEIDDLIEKFSEISDDLNENPDAIDDMSAEEFNELVNKAIEVANKAGANIKKVKDKAGRLKRIKAAMEDDISNDELNDEDELNRDSDVEYQKMKASEAEKERLKKDLEASKTKVVDKNLADFEKDLKKAINKQVTDVIEEIIEDTWSKEDRHHVDDGIAKPGERIDDVVIPLESRPLISVYFDQSGSWGNREVEKGMNAIKMLFDLEKKERIRLDIKFFSLILSTSQQAARDQGSEECWDLVIDDINAPPKTDNVIIMTDSDIAVDYGHAGCHGCIRGKGTTVPGCVWFLWKKAGERVSMASMKLKGKKGTFEYAMN